MSATKWVVALSATGICLAPSLALAYVGPGAGLTLLAALWGLLVAVLVALGFVVLWPIRRWRRRRRADREAQAQADAHRGETHGGAVQEAADEAVPVIEAADQAEPPRASADGGRSASSSAGRGRG
jgi:membrane protein implicated in regulation of membrane protease activity